MKKLELKKIEQLLSIVPDHPALRIMHITNGDNQLTDALFTLIKDKEYELLLNLVTDDNYEAIKEKYTDKEVTVKKITFEQRRYASMAKTYDYVFLSATVPETLQNQFAKTIHAHIRNTGNIILFLEKNNLKLLDSWRQVLEENYFVASNTIDLFDEYEVLSSKKMHGWGG
jgi:hypothetical protein